jgi:hypothetical protein
VNKWGAKFPAEVLPPANNGVALTFVQPLWDLIYKRNYARRTYERLQQCVQDLGSVQAHLASHAVYLQRVAMWLQQPLAGTSPPEAFAATIVSVVKEVGRGEQGVPLVLPSNEHGLFLYSLVANEQERNRGAQARAARAAAALRHWHQVDADSLPAPWRHLSGCAVLPLLPCPHRASTLKYGVRGLLEGKLSPDQWLHSQLRGTVCGCLGAGLFEMGHNSDDEDDVGEEGEGEALQRDALGEKALPSSDSEDDMAPPPPTPRPSGSPVTAGGGGQRGRGGR